MNRKSRSTWPVLLLAAPAFVSIWSGWVGLGQLTGFGVIHPLPGIWDAFTLNTAITLPIGVETYAAYALKVWLGAAQQTAASRFAKWSAVGSLALGAMGQVAYHLMAAAGITHAPWQITVFVSCLPVAVLGMGASLAHLSHEHPEPGPEPMPGSGSAAPTQPVLALEVPDDAPTWPATEPRQPSPRPSADDVARFARELAAGHPRNSALPGIQKVAVRFKVGQPKARQILAAARELLDSDDGEGAQVVPIHQEASTR